MANTRKKNFQAEVQKLIANAAGYVYRERVAVGSINGGATYNLLPAVRGHKYRITDFTIIAVGGVTAGGTNVLLKGTQAGSSVNLMSAALAQLARSVVTKPGGASTVTVLADGASFADCDENTAIDLSATGTFTGNTHFDVQVNYVLEKAA